MGEIPKEMVRLYHELDLLEQRLEKQQVDIQVTKLELNGDEEAIIYEKSEKEVVRDIEFLRKQSETFVLEDLNNYGKNLCADIGKHEVSSKKDLFLKIRLKQRCMRTYCLLEMVLFYLYNMEKTNNKLS
jgi:hypothetical protein